MGNGFVLAETGGAEEITLTVQQLPAHTHTLLATNSLATQQNVSPNVMAEATQFNPYINVNPASPMAPQAAGSVGGSQPHTNFQPYLCVDFIISLFGIFPSPT
jgi:microcystin-dependent protein